MLGEVSYESEIAGKTEKLDWFARLSKECACGIIGGCRTVGGSLVRYSAAVAEGGKLKGIVDCTHILDGEQFKSGAGMGLYTLQGIKVGICVENDFYFPESLRALTLCGAQLLVGICERQKDAMLPHLMRTYAYLWGVPFVAVVGKSACFACLSGGMAISPLPQTLFEAVPRNEYRVITTRQRGLYEGTAEDY
jgi:hypothetical protein